MMKTIDSRGISRRQLVTATATAGIGLVAGMVSLMSGLAVKPAWANDGLSADNTCILPQSSSVLLTDADLVNLSRYQLYIARNEIYARHGYIFTQQDLRDYFAQKAWYQPSVPADQFDEGVLSYIEEQNIAKILEFENGSAQKDACIFPQSSSVLLTDADLAGCSAVDLYLGRNEIYARHGYIFQQPDLANYFSQKSWYQGTIPADQFDEGVLSYIEEQNIAKIVAYENGQGGAVGPYSYVFPSSNTALLGDAELRQATPYELYIGRNEIYARHGYIFQQADLASYFGQKAWYQGTIPADQFDESVFNSYEEQNIAAIKAYEG